MARELNLKEVIARVVLSRNSSKSGSYRVKDTLDKLVEYREHLGESEDGLPGQSPAAIDDPAEQLGQYFALMTETVERTLLGYEIMVTELKGLRSPAEFIQRAERAAGDSAVHVRQFSALTQRFGVRPIPLKTAVSVREDLFEFALGLARQGCVDETFQAAKWAQQAQKAKDEEIASALQDFAEDKMRHAQLYWDLYSWVQSQISPTRCGKLRTVQSEALLRLRSEGTRPLSREAQALVGEFDREELLTLIERMEEELWCHELAA